MCLKIVAGSAIVMMNGAAEFSTMIAIQLEPDGYATIQNLNGYKIGTIICPCSTVYADKLRVLLHTHPNVPAQFRFLTSNGWPIEKCDESAIEISKLISLGVVKIQRHFDLPRLGIKWLDGNHLGFIFVNFNCCLTEVRQKIVADLGDKFFHPENDFEFLERHEWPVAQSQESELVVWDVCQENYCVINKLNNKDKSDSLHKIRKRPLRLIDKQTMKKSIRLKHDYNPTSILISYVHGEATTHARNLKRELLNMGLDKVFLDVDDIPAGQDWQDVINTALNNCNAFVALVTPRYGETRWTNREAKLADDKEKLIIPISFLEKWPPDHLAIQFLSLQYIPWKTSEELKNEDDMSKDITSWAPICVHRVAKEIKKLCTELYESTPVTPSIESKHLVESSSAPPFPQPQSLICKKDYIVISAHSKQKYFVEKMTNMLREEQFDVWPSFDMDDLNGDVVDSSCDDSQISECSPIFDSYCHDKAFTSSSLLSNFKNENSECFEAKVDLKNAENQKKIKLFKKKIKEACLVIIVMSEDYISSRTCLQLAFYCEYRREVIVIKYGDFVIDDSCILNFYPEQDMVKFTGPEDDYNILATLKTEIIKAVHEDTSRKSYKDHIQKMVANLSNQLKIDNCVYVIGGTRVISKNAESFCIALGAELARLVNLTLVTEGFFGAGDLVGRNFCEEKEIRAKGKLHSIYHIIPRKDNTLTKRARQKEDGQFEKVPYGQTLFFGDSIAERDDIVSATFKICILVEGGQRSACLAEKFLFNDCTVIPIIFNNAAISSKRSLGASLSKVPCGVNQNDWSSLVDFTTPPDALAKTVKKIVLSLLKMRKICSKVTNGS
ncbi:hypothetical protein JTE90_021568 [Oedothorax gibbosus]|uniref:TIR domain-containing protein n=1 Tax=Oedothorax gibbosus TaxID=931172 RepID=A0AAV6VR01_9ARAC|nr:hypothetical protein JTE90_021568 [Oedothorax gibbosus]